MRRTVLQLLCTASCLMLHKPLHTNYLQIRSFKIVTYFIEIADKLLICTGSSTYLLRNKMGLKILTYAYKHLSCSFITKTFCNLNKKYFVAEIKRRCVLTWCGFF